MEIKDIKNFSDLHKYCNKKCEEVLDLGVLASPHLSPITLPQEASITHTRLMINKQNNSGSIKIGYLNRIYKFCSLFTITGFIYSYHTPIGILCNGKCFILSNKEKTRLSNTTDRIIRVLNKVFYPLEKQTLQVLIKEFKLKSERL